MKHSLLLTIIVVTLFSIPKVILGQAPNLGTISDFSVFTSVGALNNLGATYIAGDVGTNVGAFTGFPPGVIDGQIHVADATSAQAALDVEGAYNYLYGMACDSVIGTALGSNQILVPNVYCLGAASTLTGDLILNGQNNPNALFIFKIDGAFSTATFSNVILTNSASFCNVYWQINGAFDLGDNSVFRGNTFVNGAIGLLEGSSIYGKAISRAGAISLHNNIVATGTQPIVTIVPDGNTTFCLGDSVTLTAIVTNAVGPFSYVWSPDGQIDSFVTVSPVAITPYSVAVTAMNSCSNGADTVVVNVNPLPSVSANSTETNVAEGTSITLTGGGAITYTWTEGVTDGVGFIPSSTTTYVVTGTDGNNCSDTASITIYIDPLPIELLSFSVDCDNQTVILKWSTATEKDNNFISIERSIDGVNWIIIGRVEGIYNSATLKNNSFIDKEPYNAVSYYRLKQTDFDGTSKYYNGISIKNCREVFAELVLYPNPVNGVGYLNYNGDKEQIYSVSIYNILGETVYYLEGYPLVIDMSDKQNGIYFLHLNLISETIIIKFILTNN